MGDAFSRYHPLVNFLFFALVLAYSMVLMHPVCLAVSLLGALLYAGQLEGRRALARHLRVALPVLLLAALVNPAFNHAGVTILIYLPSGNPLTLESIAYGFAAAAMLAAVVLFYQIVGSAGEWALTGSFTAAVQDFRIGIPGMLLQVFGGYLFIKYVIRK